MSRSMTSITGCPPNQALNTAPAPKGEPTDCLQMVEHLTESLCCFISESSEIIKLLTEKLKEQSAAPNKDKCMEIVEILSEGIGDFIPKTSEVLQKLKSAIQGKGDGASSACKDSSAGQRATTDKAVNCCPCVARAMEESKMKITEIKKSDLAKKKMMADKSKQEKREKIAQIKETMCATQKTLQCIQEQLRQLERMDVDFDTVNTADGQVNPAALYKEIMKPDKVPYTPQNKCAVPSKPACGPSASGQAHKVKCDFIYQGTIAKPPQAKASSQGKNCIPEKVSYFEAKPYPDSRCL